jgi:hypothetical protein
MAYHRARWYDARNASWLSEDPAGTVDSSNLYAYVGWGPQGATDPLGLWTGDGCKADEQGNPGPGCIPELIPVVGNSWRGAAYHVVDNLSCGVFSAESGRVNPLTGATQAAEDLRSFRTNHRILATAIDLADAALNPGKWGKALGVGAVLGVAALEHTGAADSPQADGSSGAAERPRDERGRWVRADGSLQPGKPFENEVGDVLRAGNSTTVPQVMLETESGTRVVVDWVGMNEDGTFKLTEAKGSADAKLTANQRVGYPEIATSGARVVSTEIAGLPAGTEIPPTRVRVVRPAVLERLKRLFRLID